MLGNILFFASLRLSTTLKKFILEVLYFCYFWNCLQRQFSICKRKFIFFIIVTLGFLTQGGFTTITVFNQHHLDTALNDIRLFPKKSNPLPKIRHLTIDKQKNLSQTILANNYWALTVCQALANTLQTLFHLVLCDYRSNFTDFIKSTNWSQERWLRDWRHAAFNYGL